MRELEHKQALSHVLWIGGATDTGKTTTAKILAEKYGFQLYHYDRRDQDQIERLAQTNARYRTFLGASIEERWIMPEPDDLFQFLLQSFQDRFPLVIEDLLTMPKTSMILAEGFGLIPELIYPLLTSPLQAVWLIPTAEFKRESMIRRGKPSFKDKVSNPEKAFRNVFERDMLLANFIREQTQAFNLTIFEIDGSRPIEQIVERVEQQFLPYIETHQSSDSKSHRLTDAQK